MNTLYLVETARDLSSQRHKFGEHIREVENPAEVKNTKVEREILESGGRNPTGLFYLHDGVGVFSRQSPRYPDATMNHYAVARALDDNLVSAKRFVDLGCGVGFLGNYASKKLDSEEIVFADLNPMAINQSIGAYAFNHEIDLSEVPVRQDGNNVILETGKHVLEGRVGDASQTLQGLEADCAACAPMLVPKLCEIFPGAYRLFAGVAKDLGAPIYIGHSNMTELLVQEAASYHGMEHEVVFDRRMRFSPDYASAFAQTQKFTNEDGLLRVDIEQNLSEFGLEVDETADPENRYHHKLMVSRLS